MFQALSVSCINIFYTVRRVFSVVNIASLARRSIGTIAARLDIVICRNAIFHWRSGHFEAHWAALRRVGLPAGCQFVVTYFALSEFIG